MRDDDLRAEPAARLGAERPAAGASGPPDWNSGQVMQQAQDPGSMARRRTASPMARQQAPMGGGGGSFLGTAAAAAAGVVGGSLLLGSIRSMMGGGHQQSFGDTAGASAAAVEDRRPWGDQSGGDLARDAGINDIGSSGRRAESTTTVRATGLFDTASNDDDDHDDMDLDSDDFGGDGDSDYA